MVWDAARESGKRVQLCEQECTISRLNLSSNLYRLSKLVQKKKIAMCYSLLLAAMLTIAASSGAHSKPATGQDQFPADFYPAWHGFNAKGHGPARAALKFPVAIPTILSKTHGGEFPFDSVTLQKA
jgi:hypothetical protein